MQGDSKEIEITPAMIEAGAQEYDKEEYLWEGPEVAVRKIFLAMLAARRREEGASEK